MKKHYKLFLVFAVMLGGMATLSAQEKANPDVPTLAEKWLQKTENHKFRVNMMVQLWGLYSMDQQIWDADAGEYQEVDDRFNTNLRRARLLFRGEPYPRLKYSLVLFYDLAGRDLLSSSIGGTNPAQPNIGVWDAFFQYRVSKNSQALVLTGGWFRPQMQRESITSGWSTTSFEKSMSQNYLRRHLVGAGPGRAAGLNVGGTILGDKIGLNYNLGFFNPMTTGFNGGSVGVNYAPLMVARTVIYIGDPEYKNYKIGYETNFYGKRKGISLDFNASYQGQTDLFDESYAFGPGMLLNWGPINLDGEWMFMTRSGSRAIDEVNTRTFDYMSNTGHIRLGYNIDVGKYMLEPVAMVMQFNGATDLEGQADASAVGSFSGTERTYDVGFNFYLDRRNLKVMLHYTWREGDAGDAPGGFRGNQFFSQSGVGAIQRGNWLGLGLNAIF
jgi:hypothetical protein